MYISFSSFDACKLPLGSGQLPNYPILFTHHQASTKTKKGTVVMSPRVTQFLESQAIRGRRHMPKVHRMKLVEVILALHPGDTCSITAGGGGDGGPSVMAIAYFEMIIFVGFI